MHPCISRSWSNPWSHVECPFTPMGSGAWRLTPNGIRNLHLNIKWGRKWREISLHHINRPRDFMKFSVSYKYIIVGTWNTISLWSSLLFLFLLQIIIKWILSLWHLRIERYVRLKPDILYLVKLYMVKLYSVKLYMVNSYI